MNGTELRELLSGQDLTITLTKHASGKEPDPADDDENTKPKNLPRPTKISGARAAGRGSLKVTWKKLSAKQLKAKEITGFQIQYSTNKNLKKGKNTKTVTVKNAKAASRTIKKLKSGKTYYVRIRSYKTVEKK